MRFITDLHIHSHFSRATSKLLTPEHLDYWAGIKGIKVVGTGDITHAGWLKEMKEKLEPEGNGLFRLKKEFKLKPLSEENETRFLLSGEISNIYKRGEKVRKVHNVVIVQSFEDAEKINQKLTNLGGNLKSDGRPILGLDSQDLLELVLDCNENNIFIPAHIWTPWFSMLGSKSGFDNPEDCFGNLWPYIFAIETGLSTDAPMNWLCSFLDRVALISNSDAHSPDRLGRNANIFNSELSFDGIRNALKNTTSGNFSGTIDMFPQEGKYHYDGHRKCNVCWDPVTTIKNKSICPNCGKPVTVGVMNRVIHLSDREDYTERKNRLPFYSIIPLPEILAEIEGVGEKSKKVKLEFEKTILKMGNELDLLLNIPLKEIETKTSVVLAEAIRRMRNREVIVQEGFDGEYGKIKVFNQGEIKNFTAGNGLFGFSAPEPPKARDLVNFNLEGIQNLLSQKQEVAEQTPEYKQNKKGELNNEQQEAVIYNEGSSVIFAGPGTGKTKTLTSKIVYLINQKNVEPNRILAITFTNKAAEEMKSRLDAELGKQVKVSNIYTFHGLGHSILREFYQELNRDKNFVILDENDKTEILKSLPELNRTAVKKYSTAISLYKQGVENDLPENFEKIYKSYTKSLENFNAFDFDDLITRPIEIFEKNETVLQNFSNRVSAIFVDEFQDTNLQQYNLIRLIANNNNPNLCVVGDPNQSIYSFRGGGSEMIALFKKDYPKAKEFRLKTSYRCTNNILAASSGILDDSGFLKGLDSNVKVQISEQASDKSEAEFIAREIVKLSGGLSFFSIDSNVSKGEKEKVNSLSDFAILCRTRHQFQAIEKALNDHNIPYQTVGEKPFYQLSPLSDLIKIYEKSIIGGNSNYTHWLTKEKDLVFKEKLNTIKNSLIKLPAQESLKKIKTDFFADVEFDEQDFKRLLILTENKSHVEFISALKMGSSSDTFVNQLETVALMTLHASKGLEFECVFIAGNEQGLIPYNLYNKETDIHEEARLLYVGMTRSKKFLYLSHARTRKFRNRALQLSRSRFLDKIENELIEKVKSEYKQKKDQGKQLDLFN